MICCCIFTEEKINLHFGKRFANFASNLFSQRRQFANDIAWESADESRIEKWPNMVRRAIVIEIKVGKPKIAIAYTVNSIDIIQAF